MWPAPWLRRRKVLARNLRERSDADLARALSDVATRKLSPMQAALRETYIKSSGTLPAAEISEEMKKAAFHARKKAAWAATERRFLRTLLRR